jgi:hypothetical protein
VGRWPLKAFIVRSAAKIHERQSLLARAAIPAKMSREEAKAALQRAEKQLRKEQDAWDGTDECLEDVLVWAFYALENAVIAAAKVLNLHRKKKRSHKTNIRLADKLLAQRAVASDISELLEKLNAARQRATYDDPTKAAAGLDLEDVLSQIEQYIEEVKAMV